jgi:Na+/proline symporter
LVARWNAAVIGVILSFVVGVSVFFAAVDPDSMEDPVSAVVIALAAVAMAVVAILISWVFPRTIGLACVGWTVGSIAGFVGAPIAGHPVNMLAMIPHFLLSVFVAHGIRRAMEKASYAV